MVLFCCSRLRVDGARRRSPCSGGSWSILDGFDPEFDSDAHRPDVLQVFLKDSRITAVVIALDNERMTTGSVRALKL